MWLNWWVILKAPILTGGWYLPPSKSFKPLLWHCLASSYVHMESFAYNKDIVML